MCSSMTLIYGGLSTKSKKRLAIGPALLCRRLVNSPYERGFFTNENVGSNEKSTHLTGMLAVKFAHWARPNWSQKKFSAHAWTIYNSARLKTPFTLTNFPIILPIAFEFSSNARILLFPLAPFNVSLIAFSYYLSAFVLLTSFLHSYIIDKVTIYLIFVSIR